jgi:hypothetical protein
MAGGLYLQGLIFTFKNSFTQDSRDALSRVGELKGSFEVRKRFARWSTTK